MNGIKVAECPKCGRLCGKHYEPSNLRFLGVYGMCRHCFLKEKGLVKVKNYYVPWEYMFYASHHEPKKIEELNRSEDSEVCLPKIEYCNIYKKHKITFTGASDFGHTKEFVRYFDSFTALMSVLIKV